MGGTRGQLRQAETDAGAGGEETAQHVSQRDTAPASPPEAERVPVGHTAYSWCSCHPHQNVPVGHTLYSWGGVVQGKSRPGFPAVDVGARGGRGGELPACVLVIGGTQFIGRRCVEELVRLGVDVTMITRGNTPNPHPTEAVQHVVCDRQVERERFVGIIQTAMAAGCGAVVDLCAFDKDAVCDVVIGIGSAPAHYILISTDSVYMCCLPPAPPGEAAGPGAGGGVREEAAVRPAAAAERARLQARDPYQYAYGSGKLAAEECLAAVHARTGFRYTSLRLPDVCGPRDNMGAFLRLQALVSTGMPVPVGPQPHSGGQGQTARGMRARRISVVCVDDVAAAVVAALRAGARVHGESINVAGPETSFEGFVRAVAAAVDASSRKTPGAGQKRTQTGVSFAEHVAALGFPSVDVGPVDAAKARRLLGPCGWRASALEDWILPTVEWNRDGRNAAYTLAFVRRNAASAQ